MSFQKVRPVPHKRGTDGLLLLLDILKMEL